MYEDQTYENILDRSLARVASDVDKREGSVIMNAIAPVSAEHADVYIQLGNIVNNGYADTAVREFLILRCKERGIIPYEATKATLKGKFNIEIPIGSRFNLNELNYVATAFIESADGYFYYQMECETEGTNGNKFFGELSSIEYIDKDLTGELTELLIPAEDEEDTEALRTRYLNSFDSNPFGGNKQDYVEKTDALDGVGGTVVIPVWNGGGTVKLIIINSDYGVASSTLVKAVQEAIDPDPQGTGSGIAPILQRLGVAVNIIIDDNGREFVDGVGIPIGNYVSQYDGNFNLSVVDHWLKEVKGVKYYFRYMDDMVIFGSSKEELHKLKRELDEFMAVNLKQVLKHNWQVFPTKVRGVDFVGYRFFGEYTLLRKSTCKTFKRRMLSISSKRENNVSPTYSEWCSFNSYVGWLQHCDSFRLYQKYVEPNVEYMHNYYLKEVKGNAEICKRKNYSGERKAS